MTFLLFLRSTQMNKEQRILNYNLVYSVLQLPHESIETLFFIKLRSIMESYYAYFSYILKSFYFNI